MNRPREGCTLHPSSNDEPVPRCDTCGREITTGLMAAFCPRRTECELYRPGVEEFYREDSA